VPDWLIITIICGGIGYWIATKYQLDGKAGFCLGSAFSLLFNGGVYTAMLKYDPSMRMLMAGFVILLCITFLLLLEHKTVVAWCKLAALTLILSVVSHSAILSQLNFQRLESTLSSAAADPAGSFRALTDQVKANFDEESTTLQQ